jgi:protein-S-isoprenylcysteine O-methyltransferase Ste14
MARSSPAAVNTRSSNAPIEAMARSTAADPACPQSRAAGRDGGFTLGLSPFAGHAANAAAWLLLGLGFLVRLWATSHFYVHRMRVISLEPQATLVTSGPYRFSRNPLYLGGNVFIFFGAAMLLGSPTALIATVLHLPLVDQLIRREERQLEQRFGDEWRRYEARVRRWL